MSTVNGFCERCNSFRKRYCNGDRNTCLRILFDRIEVLQQENDVIKDSFTTAQKAIGSLQQENEQLRAQTARMKDACIKGFSYLSLLFHRADIRNWNDVGMCSVKDVKHVLDELASAYKDESADKDYHNPADVEVLRKAREALIDYKTFLESFQCTCEPSNETYPGVCCERCCRLNQAKQALAEIDKVIGGGNDV